MNFNKLKNYRWCEKKIIIFKHSSLSLRAHLSSALLPYRQTCLTGTFYRYKSLVIIEHQLPYSPSGNPIIKWSTYVSQSIFSPPLNKSWWHHLNLLLLILTQMIQTKQYDKKKVRGRSGDTNKKKKKKSIDPPLGLSSAMFCEDNPGACPKSSVIASPHWRADRNRECSNSIWIMYANEARREVTLGHFYLKDAVIKITRPKMQQLCQQINFRCCSKLLVCGKTRNTL